MRDLKDVLTAATWTVGFAGVTYIMLIVEPTMGFTTPADYADPVKVLKGYGSSAWFVGDLIYLGVGIAALGVWARSDDRVLRGSAMVAGIGFLFLSSLDRVFLVLPTWLGDDGQATMAVLGVTPVRLAVLRVTVLAFAAMAWQLAGVQPAPGTAGVVWRVVSGLALLGAIAFQVMFLPVPVLFFTWSATYLVVTIRQTPLKRSA